MRISLAAAPKKKSTAHILKSHQKETKCKKKTPRPRVPETCKKKNMCDLKKKLYNPVGEKKIYVFISQVMKKIWKTLCESRRSLGPCLGLTRSLTMVTCLQ